MVTTTLREFLSGDHWSTERWGGGYLIYRSFTMEGAWDFPRLAGFREVEEWQDGHYRRVWVSEEEWTIVSYCEGDITVQLFERKVTYDLALHYAADFYSQHRADLSKES